MIPKEITEENIIQAIETIDKNGNQYPMTKSKKYDLVYNNKTYPPKLVISLANEYANGEYLTHKKFDTNEAQKYLKDISQDFSIKVKGPNVIENLIERYKTIIKENGLKEELYKWKLIKNLKGKPDVNAKDFTLEIKEIHPQENNMVYQMAKATANRMAKFKPEEYRSCFQKLFDEKVSLEKRIIDFQSKTQTIYKSVEGEHSSHQDERTISTYLTFHNPEKYTFYKSSYYNYYCKLLGIKPKDAGYKYVHYLELIHDLIDNYILEDPELCNLIDVELQKNDYFLDQNRLILAQDILYQTLIMDSSQCNYWVFQANPKYYDIESALKAEVLKTWRVSQYKKEIKTGDKVILWITGQKAGIYALATVCSEVQKIKDAIEEVEFYIDKTDINTEIDRVELDIEYNLINSPILKDKLLTHPVLKNLKQGIQGTNLKATESEYNAILKLIEMKETYYDQLIMFLKQAKTDSLKYSHYNKSFLGLKVKVSFGQGGTANIPWISFLKDGQSTSKGIYPVYLYYKNLNLLLLSYGISEENEPDFSWNIKTPILIADFFKENHYGKPFRYGKSYIFKSYLIDSLPSKDVINNDLLKLIEVYKSVNLDSEDIQPVIKIKEFYNQYLVNLGLKSSGLVFSEKLITRFTSSLLTKPFVILTGLSGSGKTKLAQAFAMWMCENEEQYCIVPVGADWTNREPLLGFPNALESGHYVKPDNKVLDLIIAAMANESKPYFLILDEMNLSHVERYFADFLSVMESGDEISLHPGTEAWGDVPAAIRLPKNLFIIGTVNIDETTYMFSPKVLDRANVIEFRVSFEEMSDYLSSAKGVDLEQLKSKGAAMAESFVQIAADKTLEIKDIDKTDLETALLVFFTELKKSGAEFGYRSAAEIVRFAAVVNKIEPEWTSAQIIDAAIMQKLLPKVHGSRRKLEPVLRTLGSFCLAKGQKIEEYISPKNEIDFSDAGKIIYPISLEKILRMYQGLLDNGFTSYAEA